MTGAGAAAWDWAAGTAWQAAVLALAVALADRVLARRGSPHLRHALWLVVLAKFALPPTLASPWSVAAAIRSPDAAAAAPAGGAALQAVLLAVWALGAVVVAAVAVRRSLRLRRALLARSVDAPPALRDALRRAADVMGVRRVPRLIVSRAASGIALVGAFRPILVVPARPIARREAEHAFLHELAHHRRLDLPVALAATAVRSAFWWHPAAWLAAARLSDVREQCCDADVAAALGEGAPAYRETLLEASRRLVGHRVAAGVAWLGARSGLVARLEALSRTHGRRTRLGRAATTTAVIVAAACAVPMGAATVAPTDVAIARRFLADAAAGRIRASCYQTRYAALRLAAAQGIEEGSKP